MKAISYRAEVKRQEEGTIEDIEVILDILAGNRNAYSEIVRKYEARVRGYCLAMLSNPTLAQDAAQDIFIKAYQALDKFRAGSSFSTWLYRIAANHCVDVLRKASRRKTESWEALLEREGEKVEALFISSQNTERAAENNELITKILSYLPERHRTIIVLREVQRLSYEELAEVLKCSIDAVKARLRRARRELESKLRHFFNRRASK
ncbi:MAG: sigma-70 family RNA polymerase sigma factor [Candidatus Omnitrophica bacterium]|nr:sigma-70 family RNA polymerase sigma factor [Candidatus Omnitrophota bacterium]